MYVREKDNHVYTFESRFKLNHLGLKNVKGDTYI